MADPTTNLRVRISADLNQFQKGMGRLRSSVSSLGGMLTGALSGLTIGAAIGGVVRATVESEQALAQLEARLASTKGAVGLTSSELVDMAGNLQKVTTFGDEAIIGAQSMLLTFTRIGKDVFPQATESVLNMATAMGTDLKSAAVQIGKALNDPVLGVTALSKAGVQFSDSQREVIRKLVETGNTAEAQRIILAELETQFGGAARAARDTLGGAFTALKEAAGDLLEGDSGSEGLVGTKSAIEDLTTLLQSDETKRAFADIATSIFTITQQLALAIPKVIEFGAKLEEGLGLKANASGQRRGTVLDFGAGLAGMAKEATSSLLASARGDTSAAAAARRRALDAQARARAGVTGEFFDPDPTGAKARAELQADIGRQVAAGLRPGASRGAGAPGGADDAAAKAREGRRKATVRLSEAELDLIAIEKVWADGAADAVQREGDRTASRLEADERARASAKALQDDLAFEIELSKLHGVEKEKAIALRYLGAEATDAERAAVVDLVDQLQRSNQAEQALGEFRSALTDFGTAALGNLDKAGDAVEEFGKRLKRLATQMLIDKAIQYLFGLFSGGGGMTGAATGGGFSFAKNHAGGLVGAAAHTARNINPLVFGGAPRYHSGGFAGLGPREVAAVLEQGEEVLTENDPRHTRNGGRNRGSVARGNTYVTVENRGEPVTATAETSTKGGDMFIKLILDLAEDRMAGSVSSGGKLGKSMQATYGVQRQGVTRG